MCGIYSTDCFQSTQNIKSKICQNITLKSSNQAKNIRTQAQKIKVNLQVIQVFHFAGKTFFCHVKIKYFFNLD